MYIKYIKNTNNYTNYIKWNLFLIRVFKRYRQTVIFDLQLFGLMMLIFVNLFILLIQSTVRFEVL